MIPADPIVGSEPPSDGHDAEHPRSIDEPRGLTLRLDGFVRETIDGEATRLGVSMEELVTFAVLYYLADVDSGRIARQLSKSPHPRVPHDERSRRGAQAPPSRR